ncbi:MAG: glycosyltransferase family 2 protein [Clostridia bacterium]|nr:glycosyltransferase family 2 protein [Clostridia bacterium]
MNKDSLVSVIVPIYKVEEYLENCVESIINQTYPNLEIILVDDGSPDNCPKICDEYAEKDERIKVIHKKNGGLSDARNAGIEVATGEFIYCVDSDDSIEDCAIEVAVEKAKELNADIVATTIKKQSNRFDCLVGDGETMFKTLFERFCWEGWGKLILRDLFADIRFPVGKLFEDLGCIPYIFLKAKKVVLMDNGMYLYTIREDSIMGKANTKLSPDLVEITSNLVDYISVNHKGLLDFIVPFSIKFLLMKSRTIKGIKNETNKKFVSALRTYFKNNFVTILKTSEVGAKTKMRAAALVLFNILI